MPQGPPPPPQRHWLVPFQPSHRLPACLPVHSPPASFPPPPPPAPRRRASSSVSGSKLHPPTRLTTPIINHLFCACLLFSFSPFSIQPPQDTQTRRCCAKANSRPVRCNKYELPPAAFTTVPQHPRHCLLLTPVLHAPAYGRRLSCHHSIRPSSSPRQRRIAAAYNCSSRLAVCDPAPSANMFATQQYTDAMDIGRKRQRDEAELANGAAGFSEHRNVSSLTRRPAILPRSPC